MTDRAESRPYSISGEVCMDLNTLQLMNEAEDGRWFQMDEETEVKVRSEDSETYQRVLRGIFDSYPNFKKLPRKTQEKIMAKAVALGLLVDWKGLKENGVELECDDATKIRVCTEYPTFRRYIQDLASAVGNFQDSVLQD